MKKTPLELTPRLKLVADLLPRGKRLVDVGTDHAYLPTYLLLEDKIPFAIAADLRKGPLSRARETAEQYGCTDRMEFRLCDGLRGIRADEVEAVAVAGMGGETIAHILSEARWVQELGLSLVLQPMSSLPELRLWLVENDFTLQKEHLVQEGAALYVVMEVQSGTCETLSPAELWAGRQSRDPLRGEYLGQQLGKLDYALEGLGRSKQEQAVLRRRELEEVRQGLADMKREWDSWQL